jgi:hypothetical protein
MCQYSISCSDVYYAIVNLLYALELLQRTPVLASANEGVNSDIEPTMFQTIGRLDFERISVYVHV